MMKTLRMVLPILIALTATAALAESEANTAFAQLKSLQGSWAGKTSDGRPVQISNRVISNGSAMMSEITGREDMITMFHLDGNRVMMTHYCASGNQPRMVGSVSPDGKTITFNFLDATNLVSTQHGHMEQVVFTLVDADHHTEQWQFATPDGKKMQEVFDLQRQK
ncbi:MAG: hypothetical protein JOZ80_02185 [Acidobacteriaceae bacterium]|nr:hypothetical protein [Acidobacteriaceae bacterium]